MTSPCLHYDCENRNSFGYCKTTACIHPKYRQQTACGTYNAMPRVVIKPTIESSAQPEIIHCRNCKYFHDSDGCFFSTAETEENGFCSWAERKDAE